MATVGVGLDGGLTAQVGWLGHAATWHYLCIYHMN